MTDVFSAGRTISNEPYRCSDAHAELSDFQLESDHQIAMRLGGLMSIGSVNRSAELVSIHTSDSALR